MIYTKIIFKHPIDKKWCVSYGVCDSEIDLIKLKSDPIYKYIKIKKVSFDEHYHFCKGLKTITMVMK